MTTLQWPADVIVVGPELHDLVRGRQPEFFHAGICLSHVVSCADALVSLSATEQPRAVITSSALPDMALENFVRIVRMMGVATVMVDSADMESSRLRSLAGEVRPIHFPITPNRLSDALRSLPSTTTSADPVVASAGFELDPTSLKVTWRGVHVPLQVRPFDLLRYLVQESPRVVSVHELASECVVASRDGGINSVRTGIGRIRNALADVNPDAAAMLQTVPGYGYRIAEAGVQN